MSRYLTLPTGEFVGYSVWPHDPLYRPVVGLFLHGRLAAHALCELERPVLTASLSRSLPARVLRRLRLSRPRSTDVPLAGPARRCWFLIRPDATLLQRLLRRDPAVTVARLEDGERLADADPEARPTPPPQTWTVERLLELADAAPARGLDGFPALIAAEPRRQLDALYMDLLGRAPDPEAHRNYLPELESGAWSVFDLQRTLLGSDEFGRRSIGLQDRVGAMITSELWTRLAEAEDVAPPLPASDRPAPTPRPQSHTFA